ncbi:hypothetical protein Trydic_g15585 [Trypoxylus dichotomus]
MKKHICVFKIWCLGTYAHNPEGIANMTSRRVYKCSVIGCNDTQSSRHVMPIYNSTIRDIWLRRINNPELTTLSDYELHQKFICAAHFLKVCKGRTKLVYGALPTIGLPGFNEGATIENSFFGNLLKENQFEIRKCRSTSISSVFFTAFCMLIFGVSVGNINKVGWIFSVCVTLSQFAKNLRPS